MAFERNNTTGDFETMLRRHLEHSNRLATPCSEFDAEVASAYLEGGLAANARSRYESHLATCTSCRHGLVALHRLSPVAEPSVVYSRGPFAASWQSLKDGLSQPGWRYGLVATASVCILLLGVYAVRRQSQPNQPGASIAMVERAPEALGTTVTGTSVSVAPTPNSSPSGAIMRAESHQQQLDQLSSARGGTAGKAVGGSMLAVPGVISGRVSSVGGMAVAEAQVVLLDPVSQQTRATTRTDALGQFRLPARPEGKYLMTVQADGYASQQIADVRSVTAQELDVKLDLGVSDRQMVASAQPPAKSREVEGKKEEPAAVRQNPPKTPEPVAATAAAASEAGRNLPDVAARRLAPREAKAPKPQPTPARSSEDENFHALVRKVRDKTFRFDRGIWIDQEYKPENRLQRTRLTHGSADYERVLTEIPSLAPFFDLGPVIVIWQGKVYEVRKP